jgi:hypothetical protein
MARLRIRPAYRTGLMRGGSTAFQCELDDAIQIPQLPPTRNSRQQGTSLVIYGHLERVRRVQELHPGQSRAGISARRDDEDSNDDGHFLPLLFRERLSTNHCPPLRKGGFRKVQMVGKRRIAARFMALMRG